MHSSIRFLPSKPDTLSTNFSYQGTCNPKLSKPQLKRQLYQQANNPLNKGIDSAIREWTDVIAKQAHQKRCAVVHNDNDRQERNPVNYYQRCQPVVQREVAQMPGRVINARPPITQS